jgi:hypothetical protein
MTKVEDPTTAAETIATPHRRTLAELTGGMGQKLEDIKGTQVTVVGLSFEVRQVHKLDKDTGAQLPELEDKDVCFILTEDPLNASGEPLKFYTFSDPLIKKLAEVKLEDLPAVAKFDIKDITGGRRVWTIS